jgi:hypothetical protein
MYTEPWIIAFFLLYSINIGLTRVTVGTNFYSLLRRFLSLLCNLLASPRECKLLRRDSGWHLCDMCTFRLVCRTSRYNCNTVHPAWFVHFRTYLHNRLFLIARWLVYSTFKLIWELPVLFFVLVYSTSGLGSVQYYMCFSTLRLVDNSWLEYVSTVGTFVLVYSTSVLVLPYF